MDECFGLDMGASLRFYELGLAASDFESVGAWFDKLGDSQFLSKYSGTVHVLSRGMKHVRIFNVSRQKIF